jgi:integrase
MATRVRNRLTAVSIKSKKAPGRYGDGGGLYLLIGRNGARAWIFRFRSRETGKLREKGLGPLTDVTLERARQRADECRLLLLDGIDPIDQKRAARATNALERARRVTFESAQDQFISSNEAAWRNAKHRAQWRSTLATYAGPMFALPVAEIDTAVVLKALEPIWTTKTETATRVRQRIEAVLDWATARGFRSGENPARWRGHLDKLLPKPNKLKKVEHHAALPYVDMGQFMVELRDRDGLGARCLELQILTAARPNEAAAARWSEFDLKNATWTIPAERMKSHREHRVPLSPDAVALLKSIPRHGEFVFPGAADNASMTTAAGHKTLQSLRAGFVPHGFRSTFRDWAADQTAYPRDVAEAALAHVLKDKTEAAYRRTDLFEKRRRLLDDWAKFLSVVPSTMDNVTPISGKSRKKRPAA